MVRVPLLAVRDQFIIIGTDGLWDAMSFAAVVSECSWWRAEHGCFNGAAEHLAHKALAHGADDNVTVVVIGLPRHGFT